MRYGSILCGLRGSLRGRESKVFLNFRLSPDVHLFTCMHYRPGSESEGDCIFVLSLGLKSKDRKETKRG